MPTGEIAEKQSEGTRAGELLMGLASDARVFRAADGRFHARVPVNGRQAIFGLKSSAFRDWLVDGYLSAHQKLPPRRAIRRVLEALEARARFETDSPTVYVRVGRDQDDNLSSYYLDLGDHAGTVIKICASGWSIAHETGIHFARPQGQLPLPVPERDGSIELLREFVNVTESDFQLAGRLDGFCAAAGGTVSGAGAPRQSGLGQEHAGDGCPAVDRSADGAAPG